ncbi:transposase, partial [Escherichia coli]
KAFLSGGAQVLEDLPGYCNQVIGDLLNELYHIEEKIKNSEKLIQQLARDNSAAQLLMQFRGIGPMTATAIVASIG